MCLSHPSLDKLSCEPTKIVKPPITFFCQLCAMMIQEAKTAVYRTMPMLLIKTLNILYAGSALPQLGSSYSMYCPISYICRTYSSAPLALTFWYYTVLIAYAYTHCSNAARM